MEEIEIKKQELRRQVALLEKQVDDLDRENRAKQSDNLRTKDLHPQKESLSESIAHNCYTCTHWKNSDCPLAASMKNYSTSQLKKWIEHPMKHNECSFWKFL